MIVQAPNPRPMQTTAGQAVTEQIDSRDAQLPPPVPVIGRLLAKGKFDFKSVSSSSNRWVILFEWFSVVETSLCALDSCLLLPIV